MSRNAFTLIELLTVITTIVDVDNPVAAEDLLHQSARHLGKVNYLTTGGSVQTAAPMAISPRLQPALWSP